jgi:hypothetical protein
MKKLSFSFLRLLIVTGIPFVSYLGFAQLPTCRCELRNDSLLNPQIYEFDIYLLQTGLNVFKLANFQAGISVNAATQNGGSVTVSLVEGQSELNPGQIPPAVDFSEAENCIRIASANAPGTANATMIPGTEQGIKVCRVRLTNSIDFGQATPDLAFLFATFPYPTVISAYDPTTGINSEITGQSTFLNSSLANPALNLPVAVYAVSGGGNYCYGAPGLPVTLSGSDPGIKYRLQKNAVSAGTEISGNGSPVTWPGQDQGTYTVHARRAGTFMAAGMDGSAVISVNPVPATPEIIISNDTLISNAPVGNHWYFNSNPIADATATTYKPLQTGYYTDIVTINECMSDTSNIVYYQSSGMPDDGRDQRFRIYPNPNTGIFTAEINLAAVDHCNLAIYNSLGILVMEEKDIRVAGTQKRSVDLDQFPNGVYLLVLRSDTSGLLSRKVIIQK